MGYSKNKNVLGGFYEYYNSIFPEASVHKVDKNNNLILCTLYMVFFCQKTTAKNSAQETK